MKRDITVLAIGDRIDHDSYRKFDSQWRSFMRYGFDYVSTDYKRLFRGKIPQIKTKKAIVFLFFPFSYWNKYIEHKNYRGIYGNETFYKKFIFFWNALEKKIKEHLPDKEIIFVNNPQLGGVYRDKLRVIKMLTDLRLSQPRLYKISNIKEIQRKLSRGHKFFLKPRYGSMGKGITFLDKCDWQTNFIFRNNRIISRRSDYGWKFRDITGNNGFLRRLLNKDIIIQEALDSSLLEGKKVDFRIYTFFDKVIYVYPRKNAPDKITTNISQGGCGAPHLLKKLPKPLITKAKRLASRVSKALDVKLAGVDIMLDRNFKKVYVIDVNFFSGFPKKRTFNLARCMAEELRRLSNNGKLCFNKAENRIS